MVQFVKYCIERERLGLIYSSGEEEIFIPLEETELLGRIELTRKKEADREGTRRRPTNEREAIEEVHRILKSRGLEESRKVYVTEPQSFGGRYVFAEKDRKQSII